MEPSLINSRDPHYDEDLSADSEQELLLERQVSDHADASREIGEVSNPASRKFNESDVQEKKLTLKREITPLSGIGFVFGQLIGSGIFITPSAILGYTGSFGLSLMCWVFGAIVALAGSLCYFELGLLVRKAGGEYAILLEAYSFRKKNRWVELLGSLISFLFTWTTVFVLRGASASIITLACARYLTRPFFIGCDVPDSVVKLLALSVLGRFIGVKLRDKAINFSTFSEPFVVMSISGYCVWGTVGVVESVHQLVL